jgi:hypothetical protein
MAMTRHTLVLYIRAIRTARYVGCAGVCEDTLLFGLANNDFGPVAKDFGFPTDCRGERRFRRKGMKQSDLSFIKSGVIIIYIHLVVINLKPDHTMQPEHHSPSSK